MNQPRTSRIRMRLMSSVIHRVTAVSVEIAQKDKGVGPHIQSGTGKLLSVNGILKRTMQR
ncbi:MAG: hypothetical protein DMG80_01015 [Acidobacteria bacterium]|nr:MAG: hypothetical protein DMG80_01015 [Acidobacteriota bacterium]